jgi:hypothetical protein
VGEEDELNNIKVASIAHCECCCRHGRKEGRKRRGEPDDLTAERDDGAAGGCWMEKRKWSFSSSIHRGVELGQFSFIGHSLFLVGGK